MSSVNCWAGELGQRIDQGITDESQGQCLTVAVSPAQHPSNGCQLDMVGRRERNTYPNPLQYFIGNHFKLRDETRDRGRNYKCKIRGSLKGSSWDRGEMTLPVWTEESELAKRMLPSQLATGAVALWNFAGNVVHLNPQGIYNKILWIDSKRASY